MKNLCVIIPFLLISNLLFADSGCLIPGYPELLTYQTNPPGGTFSNTPNSPPNPGCQWVLDTSLPFIGCVGHARGGTKGTYYQQCPIDDYVPLLLIGAGGFGFFILRRREFGFFG
ncbi:hypothetical protein ABIB40_003617 [Pedobacter sp. UYP30]|uniref:hypothetical protein n=1 Tax=Pedobacter sp. UYP30 TaxID=1756400 RepID=UPI00339A13EB